MLGNQTIARNVISRLGEVMSPRQKKLKEDCPQSVIVVDSPDVKIYSVKLNHRETEFL